MLVKENFRPEDLVEHIRRLVAKQAGSHQRDGSGIVTKLLYVEDNDDNVYMLKMRLELLGDFEVVAAENGERGCETAVAERPDIILMDLEMPVVDGWEATRPAQEQSQIPATSLLICLFCTCAWGESVRKLWPPAATSSIPNPIEFDRLVGIIRRILAARTASPTPKKQRP